MTVLITRPQPDADRFAAACHAAGLPSIVAPIIDIVWSSENVSITRDEALAFTSANGVRAFANLSSTRDRLAFCVGEVTAAAAQGAGFTEVRVANGDINSLAEVILKEPALGSIAHIAGTHRAGDLVTILQNRHINARRVVLYEAQPAAVLPENAVGFLRQPVREKCAVFFSPRSVHIFNGLVANADLLGALESVSAICLSANVADAAAAIKWQSVHIASAPTASDLISVIKSRKAFYPRA